ACTYQPFCSPSAISQSVITPPPCPPIARIAMVIGRSRETAFMTAYPKCAVSGRAPESPVGSHPHPPLSPSPLPAPGRNAALDLPCRETPSVEISTGAPGSRGFAQCLHVDANRGLHPSPGRGGGTARQRGGRGWETKSTACAYCATAKPKRFSA